MRCNLCGTHPYDQQNTFPATPRCNSSLTIPLGLTINFQDCWPGCWPQISALKLLESSCTLDSVLLFSCFHIQAQSVGDNASHNSFCCPGHRTRLLCKAPHVDSTAPSRTVTSARDWQHSPSPQKPSMASVPHLGQRVRPCRPSQYAWSIHHLAVNCKSCPRSSFQAGCHLFGSPSLGDVWRAGNEEFAYPSPTVRRAIQTSVHQGIDPTFPTEMMIESTNPKSQSIKVWKRAC